MKSLLLIAFISVYSKLSTGVFSEGPGFPKNSIDTNFYELDNETAVRIIFDDSTALMKLILYSKVNSTWKEFQEIDSLQCEFGRIKPSYSDFNEDGKKDLLVYYGTGAKGANALYYLFLQDKNSLKFHYVKGSNGIPNLSFDAERKTIEGIFYYGGTSFIDFHIVNDSLVEKGGVDVSENRKWTVREHYNINAVGERTIIKRDSVKDNGQGLFSRE